MANNLSHNLEKLKSTFHNILLLRNDVTKVKKQVNDFKDNIEKVIEQYMQNAIKSDRITINNQLEKAGFKESADLIRKL